MKKTRINTLILSALMLLITSILNAVPAIPVPITFTQPDGNTLTVRLKGDERIHWYESMDGYTLLLNQAGYLTYAQLDEDKNLQPSYYIATDIEKRDESVNSFLNIIEKKLFYSEVQKQLMIKVWEIEDLIENKKKAGNKSEVTGHYKTICAFVQFPEKPMIKDMSRFGRII